MAASSPAVRARRRAPARGRFWTWVAAVAVAATVGALALGLAFAGSSSTLASGTRIAGVAVGTLTPGDARRMLERRSARLATVPVTFTAGGHRFRISPRELGVRVDWRAAVAAAQRRGAGFSVVRGYRRLELRLFPSDTAAPARAYDAAVDYELGLVARAVNRPRREARLERHGLHVSIAPGSTGLTLDLVAARRLIVHALASFSRSPVPLPVRSDMPETTVESLVPVQRAAAQVVSAPVTLTLGPTRWRLPRWRLAKMLQLPSGKETSLRLGGPDADVYFAALQRRVGRVPRDAGWKSTSSGGVRVIPSAPGYALDVPRTAARVLAAAESSSNRVAALVGTALQPQRATAAALAMGITGTVGSFETIYGGDPNRIHNVQLVAHLVDGKLIAPGATFSFNGATGARTAARGFRVAPVIINGELQTGIGGGVCQVSTTVFNAAYEAGLPITARTNHALYISHYPLGRDATVDFPSVDLKFVNDTGHWLLLRTYVGPYSLSVVLYGVPQRRRVVTDTAPLVAVGQLPIKRTTDATLQPGQVVVDDPGTPAQVTSVRRRVYSADGSLRSDQTWFSSYRAEPKLVRVGPKQPKTTTSPAPEPPH